jgi:serine O-acetyltransferase
MGFYTRRSLNRDNLRHSIAEHLYLAHEILTEQIDRALRYERELRGEEESLPERRGEDIVLDLFRALPDVRRVLDTDVRAAYDGDPAARSIEEVVFSYPSVLAVTCYRIAHVLHKAAVPMIPRIITEFAHGKTGIELSPGAVIGESFFIDHGTGVVIGETCVLGNNIKLYQGVTLGALSVPRRGCNKKRHPTLEDEVTVYAGATILGGETVIGKGSVIGGNVWLIRSVPPGSKIFFRNRNDTSD